ncbi:HSF-type DNA-binding [Seminavis robusta]|uniref:HSF-type DNA-binding n=1 Tax=Seminavis robusta TaxID=568900 RepID=A0A9N8DR67_9STRA|nr:HSF-type DNA-binding [Seminavis robusta]|eukprot:Sro224_g091520.1 HSF-type DNA-binding (735) ;mRNA; f:7761-9965
MMSNNNLTIEDFHGAVNHSSHPSEGMLELSGTENCVGFYVFPLLPPPHLLLIFLSCLLPPDTATPKRSKLDFLAMIAEMSQQSEAAPRMAPVPAPVAPSEPVPPPAVEADTMVVNVKPPTKSASKKVTKKSPKSSFAAWKLAKGRKGGPKSPKNNKETSKGKEMPAVTTADVARMDVVVTPTSPVKESAEFNNMAAIMQQAIEMKAQMQSYSPPLVPAQAPPAVVEASPMAMAAPMDALALAAASREQEMMAAAAPKMPPKKATKSKDGKKSASAKKAGTSIKKDKDGMSAKKASKKKNKDGSEKTKSSKKAKKVDQPSPSKGTTPSFPEKIMELLQKNMASNAIYWLPEGEAIAVDPDNFKDSTVISKQFRGNKLSSFVRSLNRWGFRRIFYHSLPDKTLAFYHRLFQKQTPLLVKDMKMDGGEKEPALPPSAASAPMVIEAANPAAVVSEGEPRPEESPVSSRPMAAIPVESAPSSPAVSAPSAAANAAAAQMIAQASAAPEPVAAPSAALAAQEHAALAAAQEQAVLAAQEQAVRAALGSAQPDMAQSMLERASALELAEGQHTLQQAMIAEQERADLALQQLQAQQALLQALAEQQNAAQAEELLMQSMIAEQQRSDLALQQHQAEQALVQQMLEEQSGGLSAALGGGYGHGAEAALRERLIAQELASRAPAHAPAPAGSDVLALLQQHFQQGGHQARELSPVEQLLLLEHQQRQRQEEAAILAAHGFRF